MNEARLEAQQTVLGSILIDSKCLPAVLRIVEPEHFEGVDQFLFRVMQELYLRCGSTQQVDPVLVLEACRRADCPIEHDRLRDYIMQLMEITPTAANAERYATIVRNHARVAQIHRQAAEMMQVQDLSALRRMLSQTAEAAMDRQAAGTTSLAQSLRNFFEEYDQPTNYLPWPFAPLRDRLFAAPGDYMLLGAESSVGKTAIALQLAIYWASNGRKVDFFSLETGEEDLRNRLLAGFLGVDQQAILKKDLTDIQLGQLAHVTGEYSKLPFGIVDACEMTVADIVTRAMTDGVDIAIIDYLQLIPAHAGSTREREVAEISMAIKNAGRRTGITFLVLAQLNADNSMDEPTLDRIRESKQPRMDADLGFLLYWKKEFAAKDDPDYQKRMLKIAKNKRGPLAKVTLSFDGPTQLFYQSNQNGPKPLFRLPTVEQMGFGLGK